MHRCASVLLPNAVMVEREAPSAGTFVAPVSASLGGFAGFAVLLVSWAPTIPAGPLLADPYVHLKVRREALRENGDPD